MSTASPRNTQSTSSTATTPGTGGSNNDTNPLGQSAHPTFHTVAGSGVEYSGSGAHPPPKMDGGAHLQQPGSSSSGGRTAVNDGANNFAASHSQAVPVPSHAHANLWGYSVPSPPSQAVAAGPTSTSAPPVAGSPSPFAQRVAAMAANGQSASYPPATVAPINGNQHHHHHQSHHHPGFMSMGAGYNTSNTRPMTAPSGMNAPGYYHGTAGYPGMFSPATYSGAGFTQQLSHRPSEYSSRAANLPTAYAGETITQGQFAYQPYGYGSGQGNDDDARPPGSSGGDPFLHQPPPLAPTANAPYGLFPNNNNNSAVAAYSLAARKGSLEYPYGSLVRPGTTETVRPDTGISVYSSYSGASDGLTHPALYNTVGHPGASASSSSAGLHDGSTQDHPNGQDENGAQGSSSQQKYNFVPLPSQPKKRPRRRFEEIERLYDCNYPGCNKAYGTLNHLNAHVSMQKHGPKRLPSEFKEIRKAWRQRKKEHDAATTSERKRPSTSGAIGGAGPSSSSHPSGHPSSTAASATIKQQPGSIPGAASSGASINTTPPSSGTIPSAPVFGALQAFHGYYTSPNANAQNSFHHRPSTAPGPMGPSAFGYAGQSTPSMTGASPVLMGTGAAGFPPAAYLGARKGSITSLPPAFAAIQEDPIGELPASHYGTSHYDAQILSPADGGGGVTGYTSDHYSGQHHHHQHQLSNGSTANSHEGTANSRSPVDHLGFTPGQSSTGSPFRFSATGGFMTDGTLNNGIGGYSNHTPGTQFTTAFDDVTGEGERRASTSDGYAGLAALQDPKGRWSPDWNSLSQGAYKHEIHN